MVLYRSPERIGSAELEQAHDYMLYKLSPNEEALGNEFYHVI